MADKDKETKEPQKEPPKTLEEAQKEIGRLTLEVEMSRWREARDREDARRKRAATVAKKCDAKWKPVTDLWRAFATGPYEKLVESLTYAFEDPFHGFSTPSEFLMSSFCEDLFKDGAQCKGVFAKLREALDEHSFDEEAFEERLDWAYAHYLQMRSPRILAAGEDKQIDELIDKEGLTAEERQVFDREHGLRGWQPQSDEEIRTAFKFTRDRFVEVRNSAHLKMCKAAERMGWEVLRSGMHQARAMGNQLVEDDAKVKACLELVEWSAKRTGFSVEELSRRVEAMKKSTKEERTAEEPAENLDKQLQDLVVEREILREVVRCAAAKLGVPVRKLFDQAKEEIERRIEEAQKKEEEKPPSEKKEGGAPETT